jgi:hypothetical protein
MGARALHGDKALADAIPRATASSRGVTSRTFTDEHVVCDGSVIVYRTPPSGDVWQMRCWIREEKKYFRRSLRTRDLNKAIEAARDLYYDTRARVRHGERLFPVTISTIVQRYLTARLADVERGYITAGRWKTIETHLKHLVSFLGPKTVSKHLHSRTFEQYFLFRKRERGTISNTTLINERATITALYKFALVPSRRWWESEGGVISG